VNFFFSYMLYPISPIQLHLKVPGSPGDTALVNGFGRVLCLPMVLSLACLMWVLCQNNY